MSSYLLVERKGVALGKTFLVSDDRDEKLIGKLKFDEREAMSVNRTDPQKCDTFEENVPWQNHQKNSVWRLWLC